YKCGKLSDDDYRRIRGDMSTEAAAVLQEIETIESSKDLDALIRREISARKNKSKSGTQTSACSSCGAANPPVNKFCADCGAKLNY
ncbi:MAG TPA: zinc-ribbon domain-containing protein, partial [Terriglobia bacterium]